MDGVEVLVERRRRKVKRFLFKFSLVFGILILISPLATMFIALLLAGAAAYGLSPTRNLYQGFRASASLSAVAKNTAQEIYRDETEEIENWKNQYGDLIFVLLLFLAVFLICLFLMSIGWSGLISYFL